MRIVFSPAMCDRGADLIRVVGICRQCGKKNVAWIVRDHIITMATLPCEYCPPADKSAEKGKKRKKKSESGIRWLPGSSCFHGRVMGRNYPEMAKEGDVVT